jgi:hypothetical protein
MNIKNMLQKVGIVGKTSADDSPVDPLPFLKPGAVDAPKRRFLTRNRRYGKVRLYRKRPVMFNMTTGKPVSYRQIRMQNIADSQRQGIEVAAARRDAQMNGTMLDFKLRFFPLCKHDA